MSNFYDDFVKNYNIRNIQVNRRFDKIDYYNSSYNFKSDREETIDVEITRSGFEQLVKLDGKYEELMNKQRDEHWIRRENPAVAEAYSKYQMLLELYR